MSIEVLESFENDGGQRVVDFLINKEKEVYLTIGGETAFLTGYDLCDTCRDVFRKVLSAQSLKDGVSEDLALRLGGLV